MTTLLLFGDTESSPAMRHEVPLAIGDSFMFADIDGRRAVLTSSLERSRIAAILPDAELLDFTALGMREPIEQGHSRLEAQGEIADRLRAGGIQITVDDEFVADRRRVKAGAELQGVRAAQAATHA